MSDLIQRVEEKINKYENIPYEIEKIESLIKKNKYILNNDDLKSLEKEKENLENEIIKMDMSFENKHEDFFYSYDDIMNAPPINWLLPNIIPAQSIGVIIGASGKGKTSIAIHCCKEILYRHDNVYIIFIDGDMSVAKIKEHGISELMEKYKNRFKYAGKTTKNFSETAQKLLRDICNEQKKYKERIYLVIEDSLSLIARKKRGFIDTEYLYYFEKILRNEGGASIIIHHTNKSGVFADSQHIENFADYTYLTERNDFNSSILLIPQKISRYQIESKAYKVYERKIVSEIDFETANISTRETVFIHYILDVLSDGEMNQSEILAHLEKIKYFSEHKVGQKKAIKWLREWGDKKKWNYEQRVGEKNAIYYWLDINSETEKLAKLPNDDLKGI